MKPRNIKLDLIIATAGQLLEKLAGFCVLMVLTRYLPADRLGDYFFAASTSSLCGIATSVGTTMLLNRSVAQNPDHAGEYLGKVLSVRLPLIVGAYLLINAVTAAVSPGFLLLMVLTSAYTMVGDLWFTYSAVLLGLHRIRLRTGTALLAPAIQVVLIPIAAALGLSLEMILLILAGSSVVMVVVTAAWVHHRYAPVPIRWGDRSAWMFALASWPFLAIIVLRAANFRVDTVMVYSLYSRQEAATYETAFKLMEVSQLLVRPLVMVFFPICAAMAVQSAWAKFQQTARKLVLITVIGGSVLAITVAMMANQMMPIVWGPEYAGSGGVLRVLYLCVPMLWVGLVGASLAGALGREKLAAIGQGLSLLVNIGMNVMVVPIWGAVGAAWTTLATQSVLSIWLLLVIWRTLVLKASEAEQRQPHQPASSDADLEWPYDDATVGMEAADG